MIWTLPNILTVLRLLAAPALVVVFVFLPRPAADWAGLTIFVGASATDYIDGWMARAWEQQSKLGTMLDPIADKAMVVIALMVLAAYSDLALHLVLPAGLILFREVFVSGMREFLGEVAGTLKVTRLAKWKTASQMVAIAVLLAHGILQYSLGDAVFGMDQSVVDEILSGAVEDESGLNWRVAAVDWSSWGGIALLWLAAVLTCITGADYFLKARPHLRG
ncbi:CDP-diacylglycerol--glycerol-3-phosphate 3-phosphatidyltransferase [Pseudooceanicola nanhaiensis]|jgi:CDP-diacylglycerol--glycerol-3-phosphate 3-phosphatidyltransferase|uniref:CDP-diacylglycerol--glycerol-3-phosphate 3-phosphatidyltransferase n=1 Tax=Pseudooceanicola nanhaiensis TaxID=375761 RepID=A0A917SVR5_9RHOB|nr:CDP-diacylglycerol--glycerol-3-phosphate 3-phosphatidyltransferase [Pseudooceanicola nanhaiensis]GGL98473.1 CDP-diacylglycerol--glycerol-3-phosphate 3-phosphatidyltransferase [Pseudooceanicola nanhaiensis]